MSAKRITPRMKQFLTFMARAEQSKGRLLEKHDRQIAGRAVAAGYGMILGFAGRMSIFIISDKGRETLEAESKG